MSRLLENAMRPGWSGGGGGAVDGTPQSGDSSSGGSAVTAVGWLPSAFTVQRSDELHPENVPHPPVYRAKTIFVPSGDQAGSRSQSAVLVNWLAAVPSAFMVQMSLLCWKASLVPSGDQLGGKDPGDPKALCVTAAWPLPSGFITQMSVAFGSSRANAIFVPSGDQTGSVSLLCPSVSRWVPEPSMLIFQITGFELGLPQLD